jgi:hypothetical protein
MVALYRRTTCHSGSPAVVQRPSPSHGRPTWEDHTSKLINFGRRRRYRLSGRNNCSAKRCSGGSQAGVQRPITECHLRRGICNTILSVDLRFLHTCTTLSRYSFSFAVVAVSCINSRYQDHRTISIRSTVPCSKICDFRRSGRYGPRFAG